MIYCVSLAKKKPKSYTNYIHQLVYHCSSLPILIPYNAIGTLASPFRGNDRADFF